MVRFRSPHSDPSSPSLHSGWAPDLGDPLSPWLLDSHHQETFAEHPSELLPGCQSDPAGFWPFSAAACPSASRWRLGKLLARQLDSCPPAAAVCWRKHSAAKETSSKATRSSSENLAAAPRTFTQPLKKGNGRCKNTARRKFTMKTARGGEGGRRQGEIRGRRKKKTSI